MIEIGINSYFTLDEANKIIKTLISTDPAVEIWNNLSDDDKECLILNVTEEYDNTECYYRGHKVDSNQTLQFPRYINGNIIECPSKIKKGLLLQGLRALKLDNTEEAQMREQGIVSFSDGSGAKVEFSDSFIDKQSGTGIYNDIWNKYFREYSELGRIIAF
jgi:hypothetical protein